MRGLGPKPQLRRSPLSGRSLLPQASLLSPSEWKLLVTVHRFDRQATSGELADALSAHPGPPLSVVAVEAILDRLHRRGLLRHDQAALWGPVVPSFETLLLAQIENFFDTYVLDDPAGLRLVGEVLASHLSSQTS